MTCSMTVTLSPLFKRLTISPMNVACPRTFTWSPLIVPGPGTSTMGFSGTAGAAAFSAGAAFFLFAVLVDFFAGGVAVVLFVVAGGGASCANKWVVAIAHTISQTNFFIAQESRVFISVGVNVRQ